MIFADTDHFLWSLDTRLVAVASKMDIASKPCLKPITILQFIRQGGHSTVRVPH